MSSAVYVLPLVSLVIVFYARALGCFLRVMDHPGGHKTHRTPTPLIGGAAVVLPIVTFCAIRFWERPDRTVFGVMLLAAGGAFLLGYLDDRYSISARLRLWAKTLSVLACLLLFPQFVVDHFDFTFTAQPIALSLLAIPFSLLVLVGLMSATNMADGMNGLGCGLALIWSVFFLFYAPSHLHALLVLVILCLLVALIFNLMGRLFLGDSGSYALGIVIGLLSAYIYNTSSERLPADVIVVWFIIPVIDCLRLMADRAFRKLRSPLSPDQNHLHHRLRLLLPQWAALGAYWMLVAVPGALAIAEPKLAPLLFAAILLFYMSILVLSSQWWLARRAATNGLVANRDPVVEPEG